MVRKATPMILPAMLLMAQMQGSPNGETPPVCETVLVQENSGNGPNYHIKLCGDKALPIRFIVVDGGPLPEKNFAFTPVTFWSK